MIPAAVDCPPAPIAWVVGEARFDAVAALCADGAVLLDPAVLARMVEAAPRLDPSRVRGLRAGFRCMASTVPACRFDASRFEIDVEVPAAWWLASTAAPEVGIPLLEGVPALFFAMPYAFSGVDDGGATRWSADVSPTVSHGDQRWQADVRARSDAAVYVGSAFWSRRVEGGTAAWSVGRFAPALLPLAGDGAPLHGVRWSTDAGASRRAALAAWREERRVDLVAEQATTLQWWRDGAPLVPVPVGAGRVAVDPPEFAVAGGAWRLADADGRTLHAFDEVRGGLLGLPGEGFIDVSIGDRPGAGAGARVAGQRSFRGRWALGAEWETLPGPDRGIGRVQWSPAGRWLLGAAVGRTGGPAGVAIDVQEASADWQGDRLGARWSLLSRRGDALPRTLQRDLLLRWSPPERPWLLAGRWSQLAGGASSGVPVQRWSVELQGREGEWLWTVGRRCEVFGQGCEARFELLRWFGGGWRAGATLATRPGGTGLLGGATGRWREADWTVDASRRRDGRSEAIATWRAPGATALVAVQDRTRVGVLSGTLAMASPTSLARAGPELAAAQTIQIDAPGAPGLRVRADGGEWTRADRAGRALLPVLDGFEPLMLEIDAASLPLEAAPGALRYRLEAPRGRALRYRIPVEPVPSLTSGLESPWRVLDAESVPVGTVVLDAVGQSIGRLGHDGVLLLDALPGAEGVRAGRYRCTRDDDASPRVLRCRSDALR